MTVIHSNKIDDILTGVTPKAQEQAPDPEIESASDPIGEDANVPEDSASEDQKSESDKSDTTESKSASGELDEYGNEVEKPKVYTEQEVQRIIKERLSRGLNRQPERVQPQQTSQEVNSEDWQVQLKAFVKSNLTEVLSEVKQEESQIEWQQREAQKQADFEARFTTGINKYKDFHNVVGQMPITDSIMMSAREMDDPAAFLYAAAKLHPEELRKISSLQDPFSQARELGRLDEKMKKSRAISNAPAPLSKTKGDMGAKYVPKQSIDDKISSYAKAKRR